MARSAHSARIGALAGLGLLAALTVVALVRVSGGPEPVSVVTSEPEGIMGTSCRISALVAPGDEDLGRAALDRAERELRRVEALMSSWLADSEISRLNRAGAGERVALSDETLEVLGEARELSRRTGGAFDVTCRPLIELWRDGAERGRRPSSAAIAGALTLVGWRGIELLEDGARKRVSESRVDLGGIAKGYGIDRAHDALGGPGLLGGLIDVGGDVRVFGRSVEGGPWQVRVRDPSGGESWATVRTEGGAVCTSGHYARYLEIDGRRLSHIIDPRDGQPTQRTTSVTVSAPTALDADAWATALSVLGAEGLSRLPKDATGLVIFEEHGRLRGARTAGLHLVAPSSRFPRELRVVRRARSSGS